MKIPSTRRAMPRRTTLPIPPRLTCRPRLLMGLAALLFATLGGVSFASAADSPIVTFVTPNTSLLKNGNWTGTGDSGGYAPTSGSTGQIAEGAASNPIGWNYNTNPTGSIGGYDFVTGATNLVVGEYTTKTTSGAEAITLAGSTLNGLLNTVLANSSGSTIVFENDVAPSGDFLTETGLTTFTLGNTANVIQGVAGSNIIIDNVITGSGDALTYVGGGTSGATGGTLELGAGSANDVTGGVAANAPTPANGGSFTSTATVQTGDKNTFTGGLTIGASTGGPNAGIVKVDGANALPTTGAVTVNSYSQLLLNGAASYSAVGQTMTLNGSGNPTTAGALATTSNNVSTWLGAISLGSASSINVQGSTGSLTVSGAISGSYQLQTAGAGALKLNASNSGFSGGFLVSAGSLVAENTGALGSGAVSVSGGTLSATVNNTSIGGTLSLSTGVIALNLASQATFSLATGVNFSMTGGTLDLTYSTDQTGSIASLGGGSSFSISGGTLDLGGGSWDPSAAYDILNGFGSGSVSGLSITDYNTPGYTPQLSNGGVLTFTAASVPEPGTNALLILCAAAVAWRFRGKRKPAVLGAAVSAVMLCAAGSHAQAQYFTAGDLVVSTYGSLTNTSITDGEATPITLLEYSAPLTGSLMTTNENPTLEDQLPTTGAGANVGIQGEDGSSSEGTIQLSGNGEYLTIGGYDGNAANQGIQAASDTANKKSFAYGTAWGESTIALAQSSDTDVPRVAATIDANGNVNTSTTFTGPYNTNNPRGVYSADGTTNFYLSGQGSGTKQTNGTYTDEGGIFTTPVGSTATPTAIFTSVSTRDVLEYGGNLYYSADQNSSKGDQTGIFEYAGLPATSQGSSTGTRITPTGGTIYNGGGFSGSGSGTAVNFSPEGFAFANPTTMYVADTGDPKAGGTGDGGIQKWTLSSGTWTLDYTLTASTFLSPSSATGASDGETGFESLAIDLVGNSVDIYAVSYTAGDADPNGLYGVVDSLSNLSPTVAETENVVEVESAPGSSDAGGTDYNFKGVSFAPQTAAVPEPGTWGMAVAGLGCLMAFNRGRRRR